MRDLQLNHEILIVVANFYEQVPEIMAEVIDHPGDHADEMETSLMLHLRPQWVVLDQAGPGERLPFVIKSLRTGRFWTPRPWSASHPDSGSGDPGAATSDKGMRLFESICVQIGGLIVDLSIAQKGDMPYI